jgi:ATP-dependent Clp protease adaptor protein ClpS
MKSMADERHQHAENPEPIDLPAEPIATAVAVEPKQKRRKKPKRLPPYHVLLWNDEDHSFEYVIAMMQKLFGHPPTKGNQIAEEVHLRGRAIVLTTTKEHAELKRDQIHAFGKDSLSAGCKGSMSSTIEPSI